MRRLTLLNEEASDRIRTMLEMNLSLSLIQYIGNVLIRERSENISLGELYEEEEERSYILINESNRFNYCFNINHR
jgi:hypothetical protein